MVKIPSLRKRVALLAIAVMSYVFLPFLLVLSAFSLFPHEWFPVSAYVMHAIQVSVFLMLVYGAFAWVKPSLVPPYLTKKIIAGLMCGIVIVMALPVDPLAWEPIGTCTIVQYSQVGVTTSTDRGSEQNCIDSCVGTESARYNEVSCKFEGVDRSWSETPESMFGLKPSE